MAAPNLPVAIGLKVAAANIGEFVIIRNLTRGGQLTASVKGTDRGVNFNPAPSTAWQDGDLLQAEIRGRVKAVQQKTIRSGTARFLLAATTDTTTPGVSL